MKINEPAAWAIAAIALCIAIACGVWADTFDHKWQAEAKIEMMKLEHVK